MFFTPSDFTIEKNFQLRKQDSHRKLGFMCTVGIVTLAQTCVSSKNPVLKLSKIDAASSRGRKQCRHSSHYHFIIKNVQLRMSLCRL